MNGSTRPIGGRESWCYGARVEGPVARPRFSGRRFPHCVARFSTRYAGRFRSIVEASPFQTDSPKTLARTRLVVLVCSLAPARGERGCLRDSVCAVSAQPTSAGSSPHADHQRALSLCVGRNRDEESALAGARIGAGRRLQRPTKRIAWRGRARPVAPHYACHHPLGCYFDASQPVARVARGRWSLCCFLFWPLASRWPAQ